MSRRLVPVLAALSAVAAAGLTAAPALAKGEGPTAIAASGREVWVATWWAGGTLVALDPSTGAAARTIRAGPFPSDLALAGRSLWAANIGPTLGAPGGSLGRFDLASRGRARARLLQIPCCNPRRLAAADGFLWAANVTGDRIFRVEPRTGRVAPTQPFARTRRPIFALAAGCGGVWLAYARGPRAFGRAALLRRIDARSSAAAGRPLRVGRAPFALAVAGCTLLVADPRAGTVTARDARSGRLLRAPLPVPGARDLAVDGARVWLLGSEAGRMQLRALDLRRWRIDEPAIRLGRAGSDETIRELAVAGGAVWVVEEASRTTPPAVWRVDPRSHRALRITLVPSRARRTAGVAATAPAGSVDGRRRCAPRAARLRSSASATGGRASPSAISAAGTGCRG